MNNKYISLLLVFLIYVIAFIGGYFSSIWINNIYIQLFFADVIATTIIYIASIFLKNTSLYDPYWSLTPWVIATYFLFIFKVHEVFAFITYSVFTIWSFRLTINWIITFDNLKWEDWRYKMYREKYPRYMFEVINFIGLQMMPTVLVYGALLPLLVLLEKGGNFLSLIGVIVVLLGISLEFFADHQMHHYLKNTKEKVTCKEGLWKYSRHPNYLGENLIWIGLFISLIVVHIEYWYLFYGFTLILLLFEFISIPLMEKRQIARRSDYSQYIKATPRMVPFTKYHHKELKEIEE